MVKERIEEFLGDLNYELQKFVRDNKNVNNADIFNKVEELVRKQLNVTSGSITEALFAVVNPENDIDFYEYRGNALKVFSTPQVPIRDVLVVRD